MKLILHPRQAREAREAGFTDFEETMPVTTTIDELRQAIGQCINCGARDVEMSDEDLCLDCARGPCIHCGGATCPGNHGGECDDEET